MNSEEFAHNMESLRAHLDTFKTGVANATATGSCGGGMVQVTLNGYHRLLSVKIDPLVFETHDAAMLEELIVAAALDADDKVDALQQELKGPILRELHLEGV